MEIRIGVQNVTREIVIDSDETADAVAQAVASAMEGPTLELRDGKGRRVIVPTASLAYVEMGTEERRRVGFSG